MSSTTSATGSTAGARERILESAYRLFATRGVRGVGIDEVVREADVAKATLYRHFPSKDALALAFLERRAKLWTRGWVEAECKRRGSTPEERLLAVFDIFDEWFRRDDFEGCSFINVLLETNDRSHPVGRASVLHLADIRAVLTEFAAEAELRDVDGFVRAWHILMKGSIVAAAEGDAQAARRAKKVARLVLDQHRPD